jgi:hypothetical protein
MEAIFKNLLSLSLYRSVLINFFKFLDDRMRSYIHRLMDKLLFLT